MKINQKQDAIDHNAKDRRSDFFVVFTISLCALELKRMLLNLK